MCNPIRFFGYRSQKYETPDNVIYTAKLSIFHQNTGYRQLYSALIVYEVLFK